jgi:nitrite reductase/ring-hydroxylating ferredoxin subunit
MTSKQHEVQKCLIGTSQDVTENSRLIVDVAGTTVGIYRLSGKLYAYENRCPHQGGPVCQGLMVPRVLEMIDAHGISKGNAFEEGSMHIACPWHGSEFDLRTGWHAGGLKIRLKDIPVDEVGGSIYVTL